MDRSNRSTGSGTDAPKPPARTREPELTTMKLRASSVEALARDYVQDGPPSSEPITDRPPSTPAALVLLVPGGRDRATLMVLSGPGEGATFTLEHDVTILGRSTNVTIPVDDASVSRRHARITRGADGGYSIEDLGSTNGTFVGGRRVQRATLTSGERVQLGRESVFRFAIVDEAEEALQRRLYESSLRDGLTALANRRCLFERLRTEIWHARRERKQLALLMIDVDHFKGVNDRFGHQAGDEVLRAIAQAGGRTLRGGDLFARYGGEELAVVARDAGTMEATVLAERLRAAIAELTVEVGNGAVRVTVSIGLAALSECDARAKSGNGTDEPDEGEQLVGLADARLYEAKRAGRNRVCARIPEAPPPPERLTEADAEAVPESMPQSMPGL
jgi:two-component system cell cycle response regulator